MVTYLPVLVNNAIKISSEQSHRLEVLYFTPFMHFQGLESTVKASSVTLH